MYTGEEFKVFADKISSVSAVEQSLLSEVKQVIDKAGLIYRSFIRVKSAESAYKKLQNPKYCADKRLQDLIGVRIVMYFKDDVELCQKIIEHGYKVEDISRDENNQETFKPTRLNIVCDIPQDILSVIDSSIFESYFIDKTFEIQLRTMFSEGWHEVDHDLRYKYKEDWSGEFIDYSRALNGIFATLETCDRAMLDLLHNFCYAKYKSGAWEAMIRNKLRIRLSSGKLSSELKAILDKDTRLAKKIFTLNRDKLLERLAFSDIGTIPKDIDNMLYIINALYMQNEAINKITPEYIKKLCCN